VRHYYASQTYISASDELNRAISWLESLGVRCSGTRVTKYRNIFSELARLQLEDRLSEFNVDRDFEAWSNAVHEVNPLIRIHEGLSSAVDPSLLPRLKSALRGHAMYVLDNDNRSGRDFTFELSVVAKFAKQGYQVNFNSDADVEAIVDGAPVYVECKRLKSEKKVEERIKEGVNQLTKRYAAAPNPDSARGFLALSIGKVVNPSLQRIVGLNDEHLGQVTSRLLSKFIDENRKHWQLSPDPRTLGVIAVLDTPAELTQTKQLTTVHEAMLDATALPGTEEREQLEAIVRNVFAPRT
jgi:hypothetical protein